MELDETGEMIYGELESAANYMRGMAYDPTISKTFKDALMERVNRIDAFLEQFNI